MMVKAEQAGVIRFDSLLCVAGLHRKLSEKDYESAEGMLTPSGLQNDEDYTNG
jgi:hypothetical protein